MKMSVSDGAHGPYRLYHMNGTPREAFVPSIEVDLTRDHTAGDAILSRVLKTLD